MTARLTVLQVLPELEVGGVERGTLEIADALVKAGHRALVVSAGGRLVEELIACGGEHIELDVGRKSITSAAHVGTLANLYATHEVDVVHARSRLPAWIAWWARRRYRGSRIPRWVTTVHGPYSVNRYSRILLSGERVIAISEFIRDYMTRNYPGYADGRIEIIARGVDRTYFNTGFTPAAEWQREWNSAQPRTLNKILLTMPGRLTRWKGQLDFIAVLAGLRQRGLNVHGLVVGGAHRRKPHFANELRAAVQTAGVADDITFLGNRNDLREILAVSSLAYSLTGEPEAFGRTTLEALSLGTPVVGYDHGGTGEILRRMFSDGLVPFADTDAAIERSVELLAANMRVAESEDFSVAQMQARTLALYSELANATN